MKNTIYQKILNDAEMLSRKKTLRLIAHGIGHTERVVRNARMIAKDLQINREDEQSVILAAWLHDVGRSAEEKGIGQKQNVTNHSEISYRLAGPFLSKYGINADQINAILNAIREHTNKSKAGSLVGQILQDADKLDGIGEIGFIRTVLYRTSISLKQARALVSGDESKVSNEEVMKLIEGLKWVEPWVDWFNTEVGHRLAQPRAEIIVNYRKKLEHNLGG